VSGSWRKQAKQSADSGNGAVSGDDRKCFNARSGKTARFAPVTCSVVDTRIIQDRSSQDLNLERGI